MGNHIEIEHEEVIGIIYRPPHSNVRQFTERLTEMTVNIMTGHNWELFLLGDFNIDYSANTSFGKRCLKEFESLTGLKQIIKQVTRFSDKNSVIDHIYTNSNLVQDQGTLPVNLSDHELIYVSRKKMKEKFQTTETQGRSYMNYDKETFQRKLRDTNWDNLADIVDVNQYWSKVEVIIRAAIDSMCPLKRMVIKDKGDPWISNELVELIKDID